MTTFWPSTPPYRLKPSSDLSQRIAPAMTAPELPPTRSPSVRIRSTVYFHDSSSFVLIHSSTLVWSRVPGMKSYLRMDNSSGTRQWRVRMDCRNRGAWHLPDPLNEIGPRLPWGQFIQSFWPSSNTPHLEFESHGRGGCKVVPEDKVQ